MLFDKDIIEKIQVENILLLYIITYISVIFFTYNNNKLTERSNIKVGLKHNQNHYNQSCLIYISHINITK